MESRQLVVTTNNPIENRLYVGEGMFDEFIEWIDRGERTTQTYIFNLRQFYNWIAENGISQPTHADIVSYRDYLKIKKFKPATIAAYIRSVKQFFKWTAASGYYPDVAGNIRAPKLDVKHHKKDALTPDETLVIEKSISDTAADRITAASENAKDTAGRIQRSTEQGKRLYAMYLLTVNAGLRTIEIHRANIGDLERKGDRTYLYIWGKGHTEPDQRKPLSAPVTAAIDDYIASRKDSPTADSPLFVSTGNRSSGNRIATTTISKMLKNAMQTAGFDSERITAHSLRHTAGTAVQEITGRLEQTQEFMRHVNPATTEIYLHNSTERQQAEIADRLYNYYHGIRTSDTLSALIAKMTPAQLEKLTAIAAAMLN